MTDIISAVFTALFWAITGMFALIVFIIFLYGCFRIASVGWHRSKLEYLQQLRKLGIGEANGKSE